MGILTDKGERFLINGTIPCHSAYFPSVIAGFRVYVTRIYFKLMTLKC